MIHKIDNFLTPAESKWYIDWYNSNPDLLFRETNEYVQNFEGIEVDRKLVNFPLFKKISPISMDFLRIQRTSIEVKPLPNPHTHVTPYNFIIFLNEEFEGGNLIFETGEVFKPEVGTMVLFEHELHYPTPVTSGERWIIACFLNSWINTEKRLL